jgi:hypothetical protein
MFEHHITNLKKRFGNKKIVLYGAGLFTKEILDNHNLDGLNIIAVADLKFKEEQEFYGLRGISPEKISELCPDIILISALRDSAIKSSLNKNYPELKKIKKISILKRTFNDKIKAICEIFA